MGKFTDHIEKLKKDMAPMTGRQRLDHLWTYYKWVLLVLVLVIGLVWLVADIVVRKNVELVFSGVTVNVPLNEDGRVYLKEQWMEKFEKLDATQEIVLEETELAAPEYLDNQTAYARSAWMTTQVMGESLDYVLTDKVGFDFYGKMNLFGDIRTVLTPEQTAALSEYFLYSPEVEGEKSYPIAIDISHLDFVRDCVGEGKTVCLMLLIHTPRADKIPQFVDHLLTWEKKN